jgi:hypothetical protein
VALGAREGGALKADTRGQQAGPSSRALGHWRRRFRGIARCFNKHITAPPPGLKPAQSNSATQKYLESYEAERDAARAAKAAAKAAAADGEAKPEGAGQEEGQGAEEELSDEQKDDLALQTIMEVVTDREAAAATSKAVNEVLSAAAGGGAPGGGRDGGGARGAALPPPPVLGSKGGREDGVRLDDRCGAGRAAVGTGGKVGRQ